jgi:hypothetical protein
MQKTPQQQFLFSISMSRHFRNVLLCYELDHKNRWTMEEVMLNLCVISHTYHPSGVNMLAKIIRRET